MYKDSFIFSAPISTSVYVSNNVIIIDDEKEQQPEPRPSTSTAHYHQEAAETVASTLDGDSYHSDDDDELCIMCGQFSWKRGYVSLIGASAIIVRGGCTSATALLCSI